MSNTPIKTNEDPIVEDIILPSCTEVIQIETSEKKSAEYDGPELEN